MDKPLAENVLVFIKKCADEVGDFENDNYNQELFFNCIERGMESPIEHILYCAVLTVARLNFIYMFTEPTEVKGKFLREGLSVTPQVKKGSYRVDFEVSYGTRVKQNGTQRICKTILIECDSQIFHERTEKERRYEKKRDRYLQSQDYKVFHFTGSEIVSKSLDLAVEILSYLTERVAEDMIKETP